MKIDDDHLYHGAALIQIAEDPHFTAINGLGTDGTALRNAFRVNADIGVLLKYSSTHKGRVKEYQFNFTREHLEQLEALAGKVANVFVALVCVKDRQICCLPLARLNELITRRRNAMRRDERQYVVLVTLPLGKGFRVYVSVPRQKMKTLGEPLLIARNGFPGALFS